MKSGTRMAAVVLAAALAAPAMAQNAPENKPNGAGFDPVDVVKLREDAEKAQVQAAEQAARLEKKIAIQQAADQQRRTMQQRTWVDRAAQPVAGRFVDFDIAVKLEKAPFLGVSVSPPGPAMREQLKLAKGVGLIVDFVEPKSPAEAAGLKQYDILEKIDDQLLINSQQLSVLVRSHKMDDEIGITVMRQGQRMNIKAKLQEKELPPIDEAHPWGAPMPPAGDAFPRKGNLPAEGLIDIMTDITGTTHFDNGDVNITLTRNDKEKHAQIADSKTGKMLYDGAVTDATRKTMPPRVTAALAEVEGAGALPPPQITIVGNGAFLAQNAEPAERVKPVSLTFVDDDHILEFATRVKDKEKKVILTAKTTAGTIVFDGPVSTDEERKELPKDIAKKLKSGLLKKMISSMGGMADAGGGDVFNIPVAPGGGGAPVRLRLTPPPAAGNPDAAPAVPAPAKP